jgi:hypothetical protein
LSISDPGVYESSAFKGVFDGNGYSIKNMRVSITAELEVYTNLNTCYLGLFATTNNASIINLNLEEGEIDARIENATLDENGSATGPSEGVICSGGLIGSAKSTLIENCLLNVQQSLSATFIKAGGIVGNGWDIAIHSSISSGNISVLASADSDCSQYYYIGGLAGQCFSLLLERSKNLGNIYASLEHTGEGLFEMHISIGGCVGYNMCSIGKIEQFANYGEINVKAYQEFSPEETNFPTHQVNVGGIIGYFSFTPHAKKFELSDCYNSGNLTADSSGNINAGGMIGELNIGEHSEQYQKQIRFSNFYNNGLIIAECSDVLQKSFGGLVGTIIRLQIMDYQPLYLAPHFQNCYSLVSDLFGKFLEYGLNIYVVEASRVMTADNCKLLSVEDMKTKETLIGYNFMNIWNINDNENNGYPFLRCFTGDTGEYLLGDVNKSCKIDTGDAVMILRWAADLDEIDDNEGAFVNTTLKIDDIRLGYMKVFEQNRQDSLLLPVWMFYGTQHDKFKNVEGMEGWVLDENDERPMDTPAGYTFLIINAIDGSIIDPIKGY